ncbi:MAG: hypothetical protein BIFFINMI_01407 [Phycisphaerae bacterium]|nr:hypothetical protein [Phycisphaerae bacterium]
MNSRILLAAAATLLLAAGLRGADVTPAAPVPPPPDAQDYLPQGRVQEYGRAIQEFLTRQPDSPEAPRLAMDLYMLLRISGNQDEADKLRGMAIFSNPRTLQGVYLASTLASAADYRDMMKHEVRRELDANGSVAAEAFVAALQIGVRRFKNDLFSYTDGFNLLVAAVCESTPQAAAVLAAMQQASQGGALSQATRDAAATLADPALSPGAKMLRIDRLDVVGGELVQAVLALRLTDADLADPQIVKSLVGRLIRDGNMAGALERLDRLPAGGGPDASQLLLWRGWCELSAGKPDAAAATFKKLHAAAADDPWRAIGDRLAASIPARAAMMKATVELLNATAVNLRRGVGGLEVRTEGPPGAAGNVQSYVGMNVRDNLTVIHVRRGDRVLLACRVEGAGARFFAPREGAWFMVSSDFFPLPPAITRFMIGVKASGGVAFDFLALGRGTPAQLADLLNGLLCGELFFTRTGLTRLVDGLARGGWAPVSVQSAADGACTATWIHPKANRPAATEVIFTVSRDGQLQAVSIGQWRLALRYGSEGSFKLDPPAMPDGPVRSDADREAVAAAASEVFKLVASLGRAAATDIRGAGATTRPDDQ